MRTLRLAWPRDAARVARSPPRPYRSRRRTTCAKPAWFALWATAAGEFCFVTVPAPRHGALDASRDAWPVCTHGVPALSPRYGHDLHVASMARPLSRYAVEIRLSAQYSGSVASPAGCKRQACVRVRACVRACVRVHGAGGVDAEPQCRRWQAGNPSRLVTAVASLRNPPRSRPVARRPFLLRLHRPKFKQRQVAFVTGTVRVVVRTRVRCTSTWAANGRAPHPQGPLRRPA